MGISTLRRHKQRDEGSTPADPIPAVVTREQHRTALQEQQKSYELRLLEKDKEIAALKGGTPAASEVPPAEPTPDPETRPEARRRPKG